MQSVYGVNSQEKNVFDCGSNVFSFHCNTAVHHINESILLGSCKILMDCAIQAIISN